MSRKMKVIFTISVLLNVLFLGATMGIGYHRWHDNPWQETKKDLSPQGRNVVASQFQAIRNDVRGLFVEGRQAHRALAKTLTADEFDSETFEKEAKALMDVQEKIMRHKIDTVKNLSEKLPEADRKKLARKLANSLIQDRVHDRKKGFKKPKGNQGKEPAAKSEP